MFLLPLLVLLVLWAALVRRGWDVRAAFLSAQVIQAVLVVFWTEVLGACGALSALPMAAGWSVFLIISLVFMFSSRDRRSLAVAGAPWSAVEKALLAASVCIAAVTGLLALLSPPNTCDAMSYHMARVAHWAYNGTLANYPTNTLRQLVIQPYSEYAILQTYVLSGSDRFANLVQWNAMASSLVGVSLAASLLGGGRFVQLCAVWFAASFPMGILQASSTQTDYVAAFWAVCSAVFALLLARTQKRRWGVLLALAFGVAVFTKGTAVILGGLFLLWGLSRSGWRSSHKCGLVLLSAGIVLALHAGFLVRMTQLSANPFSALSLGGSAMVQRVDVRATLSNLIRGVATGLATPWHGLNRAVLKVVAVGHQWLGIAPNDPRFTLDGHEFMLAYLPNWEDYATGLVHSIFFILVAIGIGVSAFLVAIRSRRQGPSGSGMSRTTELAGLRDMGLLISFSAVFFLAVLVFCALVSWQEWIPRFQLPFFIIFSPVAAVAAGRFCRRAWLLGLGICMAILAWTPLLYNKQCPLLPSGAVSRDQMAAQVKDGGTVFDWMQQNGYFAVEAGSRAGYLAYMHEGRLSRLFETFPEQFSDIHAVLSQAVSFPYGMLFASREELFFARYGKALRDEAHTAIRFIRRQLADTPDCHEIGLFRGETEYEYPFWALLDTSRHPVRVEHLFVENVSGRLPYPRGEPQPCLIIWESDEEGPNKLRYRDQDFRRAMEGHWKVYVSEVAVLSK